MSCGVRPSARARDWSTSSLSDGIFSPQLRCGSISRGSARMTSRTRCGGFAHDVRLRSNDAELHRKSDRRAEIESIELHPRRAERAFGDRGLDARLDALARFDVARDDDDLGEEFVRLDRLEPEPEPGRALADIGGIGLRVGVAGDQAFRLLHRRLRSPGSTSLRRASARKTIPAVRTAERTAAEPC